MKNPYEWDEQHAAFLSGVEYGRREANRAAAEAIAHELLHQQSLEMLGMAREYASAKGPHWAAMVCGED